jgi:hypothetical protein
VPIIYEAEDIWIVWNDSVSATATSATIIRRPISNSSTSASTCNHVWKVWSGTGDYSSTGTCGASAWVEWNRAYIHNVMISATLSAEQQPARRSHRVQMSAEERQLHEQYERDTERKYQEERAARIAAEVKAELLLQRLLTAEQRETLEKKNHFYLYSGGRKFRIDRGQTGNVKLVDEKDRVVQSYCIHPAGVPDADAMAAQKLMLEADPETFERVANITYRNGAVRRGTPLRAVG